MIVFLLALLATSGQPAATLPKIKVPPIRPEDYTAAFDSEGRMGAYAVRLTVSPTGEITRCVMIQEGPSRSMNRILCGRLLGSAIPAAKTYDDQPAYGVFTWVFNLGTFNGDRPKIAQGKVVGLTYDPQPISIPGSELTVAKLPAGVGSHASAGLVLTADEAGRVTRCDVAQSSGSDVLDRVACKAGVPEGWIVPVSDRQGRRVASVQALTVSFVEEGAAH